MRGLVAPCALALWAAGCLPDSGNRYAGLAVHDDEAGRFRVRYQSPPWEEPPTLVGAIGDAFAVEIESPYDSLAGRRKVYELGVSVIGEPAVSAAPRIQAEVLGAGHELVSGLEEVESDSGDAGFDLVWTEDVVEGRHRRARIYGASFGSVVVQIRSNPDPRNQDIDRMLDAIDVEPARRADGGP